ncbi:hypothetical protein VHUM_02085 [Vanrija humicola]|uniref:N-acetyl-D-glucosamine kinase n=1 Tax=Vanrija humicola TaxID=5417 RepID=A0A7D8Z3W6_VANHU|nr:hypothetical protein VHUM_02085 [Vanrija humicola]
MSHAPSPPSSTPGSPSANGDRPQLILCADGGGSKVCVVIRSSDGIEVRGTAGPCNVQSVGHIPAADRILEATYKALSLLPVSYLPDGFTIPNIQQPLPPHAIPSGVRSRMASPHASGTNTPRVRPPPLSQSLFALCWIALAGFTTDADTAAFLPFISTALNTPGDRFTLTNDVNLLAAPAVHLSGLSHCVAVVCGTGTIARTIKVGNREDNLPPSPPVESSKQKKQKGLPLQDIGVSRGWGYMLDDEGSAFWVGRLAIRYVLGNWDRAHSTGVYSSAVPETLPLHTDLLEYFEVDDPTELIGIVSLMTSFVDGLTIGEASAKRNAYQAGAGRVVFKWAFPADSGVEITTDLEKASHEAALKIAKTAIEPLVDLTISALGDGSVVEPSRTALTLGGGLMNSNGYRQLLLQGLKARGVSFRDVLLVDDAAGEGGKALAAVAFGQ